MTPAWLVNLSPRLRYAVLGAALVGVPGCVAGLVLGLQAYPPTAWAAVVEVGAPAAVVGGLLGLVVGSLVVLVQRRG